MTIQEKLDRLYILRSNAVDLQLEKDKSQSAIIPKEIRDNLNMLEEKYAGHFSTLKQEMQSLEESIRRDVIQQQENYKGASGMSALYMPGRITWDTRGLEGYSKAHPEVLELRRVGEPFVTIKGV